MRTLVLHRCRVGAEAVAAIGESMPLLRTLVLEGAEELRVFGGLKKLHRLELVGCTKASREEVLATVAALPQLQSLRLVDCFGHDALQDLDGLHEALVRAKPGGGLRVALRSCG